MQNVSEILWHNSENWRYCEILQINPNCELFQKKMSLQENNLEKELRLYKERGKERGKEKQDVEREW